MLKGNRGEAAYQFPEADCLDEGEQYDSFPPYWKELDPINKLARQQIGLKDPQEVDCRV